MSPFWRFSRSLGEPRIAPLSKADHRQVLDAFNGCVACHAHQDWHTLPELLRSPNVIGWLSRDSRPVVALAAASLRRPPPNPRRGDRPTAWLRLVYADPSGPASALDSVWAALLNQLKANAIAAINVVAMENWIKPTITRWGFRQVNSVISLRCRHSRTRNSRLPEGMTLRPADDSDAAAILAVDAAAFEPMWQYDEEMLELAWRHAATVTLLEMQGRVVGYQLSTWHIDSGHLARLAISPDQQGKGLGGLLIEDMLRFFAGRGTRAITVNTQEDNIASQALYQRYGFARVNQQVGVWSFDLR